MKMVPFLRTHETRRQFPMSSTIFNRCTNMIPSLFLKRVTVLFTPLSQFWHLPTSHSLFWFYSSEDVDIPVLIFVALYVGGKWTGMGVFLDLLRDW